MGRPRTRVYKRGERLYNYKVDAPTRWRYISEAEVVGDKRKINVVCDCGAIHTRYLSEILHGKSTGCRKCMAKHGGRKGPIVGSMRWCSQQVGKELNYFGNMKASTHEKFNRIMKLGKGDLVEGYFLLQEFYSILERLIEKAEDNPLLISKFEEFVDGV
jgi:hypothetical protein